MLEGLFFMIEWKKKSHKCGFGLYIERARKGGIVICELERVVLFCM